MKKVKYKAKKKKGGIRKVWKLVIVIAIILAVLVAGFFRAYQIKTTNGAVQYGFNVGYQKAVIDMMNASLSCQPVPLYAGNTSIEMIAVDCLQVQAPTQ